ncbi:MAG: hypothetical protein ACI308_09910 [Muribaculaceae bacterium]
MKKFKSFGNSSLIEDTGACELYKTLCAKEYAQYPYERCDLDDGMSVINQVIGGYWKPRFLMDERNKTAVEFMDRWTILKTTRTDDIDWLSLKGLPQNAIDKAKGLNDREITIYSYVDRAGKPLVMFRNIKDNDELNEMEKETQKN